MENSLILKNVSYKIFSSLFTLIIQSFSEDYDFLFTQIASNLLTSAVLNYALVSDISHFRVSVSLSTLSFLRGSICSSISSPVISSAVEKQEVKLRTLRKKSSRNSEIILQPQQPSRDTSTRFKSQLKKTIPILPISTEYLPKNLFSKSQRKGI